MREANMRRGNGAELTRCVLWRRPFWTVDLREVLLLSLLSFLVDVYVGISFQCYFCNYISRRKMFFIKSLPSFAKP